VDHAFLLFIMARMQYVIMAIAACLQWDCSAIGQDLALYEGIGSLQKGDWPAWGITELNWSFLFPFLVQYFAAAAVYVGVCVLSSS
jgi:hypothetical protein